MLQAVRHRHQISFRGRPIERVRAALAGSPLVRGLVRRRQAVTDALGWCGWVLAGGAALFASWELGGFSVLLGQEPLSPPAVHRPANLDPSRAPTDGPAGCTQAPIDRATGLTIPVDCPASALSVETLTARLTQPASPR